MKVSKVVLIVVALHVLVIGGIFIFEGCSRAKVQAPAMADNESLPADQVAAANATALPAPTGPDAALQGMTPVTPGPLTLNPPAGLEMAPGATALPIAPAIPARTYTIKKGDSLWKIAKAENISMAELCKANNLTKTSILKIGQQLTIPTATPTAAPTAVATATPAPAGAFAPVPMGAAPIAATSGSEYVVKSGDSLWRLARTHGTTVAAIKQANNLRSDALKIGQKLQIPTAAPAAAVAATTPTAVAPVSAGIATTSYSDTFELGATQMINGQQIHIVDIGESPSVIAKKYGVKVGDLMRENNITDARRIYVGQKLVIPQAIPAPTVSAAPVAPITASAN